MKSIQWKVVINDNNQIASMEQASGFALNSIESHLTIIGLLENLKQQHQNKLNVMFDKVVTNPISITPISKPVNPFDDEDEEDDDSEI